MTSNEIKVLFVDDSSEDVYIIRELLKDITTEFKFFHEPSLNSALELIQKEKFDCVLLDLNLPDSSGTDTLKSVLKQCPELPIVVLTILDDEDMAIQSLHDGAQDYLVKGKITGEIVSRSIRYAIERKKVENALIENEKKYRNIVDTTLEGLWVIDTEGITTYVNKQLVEMLGYTEGEILGQPFFNFVDGYILNDAKQFFERRKKGIKDRYDFRFIKKDSSILWVIVSASPIFDENGKFTGAIGLLTDITERKLMEQSLERSIKEWDSTFNAISDTVCIVDLNGEITRCNDAAKILFKTTCEEDIIGKNCWEILTCPPDRLEVCPILKAKESKKRETLTVQVNNKWYQSSLDPIIDSEGNIIGGVHIISDITKYKVSQEELKESEQLYRTITEYSNDMIWTLDTEGHFTFFNKRAEQISGYKLKEMKSTYFGSLVIKQDLDKVIDLFHSTLNGQYQQYEVTFINKYNKHITLSVNAAPIYSKGKIIGTISSGRDITETVKYAKELKILNEKLETSNKELQDFAYIASHDLQEPLRSIYSFTELMARRYKNKLDPDADKFIDYIISGTRRMQDMIDDLLALSRVGTRGKELLPTNVSDILNSVFKSLHSMIERNNATITIDDMPIINADSFQLTQLFQNLIDNAIKFRREENPNIHISAKQENGEYIFSVKDNGIGISEKDSKKLFKAFTRLHSRDKYPGTGIGLVICKRIVERHKGRMWLESKLGEGTTFYFTIPIFQNNSQNNNLNNNLQNLTEQQNIH